jgi:HAD superfamily hydrolase (TIGR01509 family)
MAIRGAISAVVFDIGDTLLDATSIEAASLRATAEHLALPNGGRRFIECYRETAADWGSPDQNRLFGLPFDMFSTAWERSGLERRDACVALRLYQTCVRWRIGMALDVVDVFRSLKKREYRIGIASDGTTPEQIETLRRLGVSIYVDAVVTSDSVGAMKPDAGVFDAILRKLGVSDPKTAVHVGDSVIKDMEGARKAGMQAIRVVRTPDELRELPLTDAVVLGDLGPVVDLLPERAGVA